MHSSMRAMMCASFATVVTAVFSMPILAADSPKDIYVKPMVTGQPHICTPYYPQEALENHITGKITLQFTITTQGTVSPPEVIASSGDDSLDAAAQECASHWQYSPATRNGNPVAIKWRAQVIFDLPRDKEEPQASHG